MQDVVVAQRREPELACLVCGETVMSGEVVIFDHGDLIHLDCSQSRPGPRRTLARVPSKRRSG